MPKRGRPSIRTTIHTNIIDVLSSDKVPLTISFIRKRVSERVGRQISWNTIEKYMSELVQMNKIQKITLEHSKKEGKEGLTVYTLKK